MQMYNNIQLRKIKEEDTSLIIKWRNSENVKKNLFTQSELTEEQHLWWLKNKVATKECVQFIIETIEPPKPIGTVFIKNIDKMNNKGEYGIFIGEEIARGCGYGTVAAQLVIKYAFKELNLNRLYLSVFSDNVLGIRSYEKAGFKKEGILRQDFKRSDGYSDVVLMSILKSEWEGLIK